MAGAVLMLALATQAALATPSTTGIRLDLQVNGAIAVNKRAVFPLPYDVRTDRSATVPNNGFYFTSDGTRTSFNSQNHKSKRLIHKMKNSFQTKENKETASPHLEQDDGYTGTSYVTEGMVADFSPKIITTGSNSDEFPQVERVVEEGNSAHEYTEQTFGSGIELLHVRQKLQKLDFYFNFLGIVHEDCRQRILCEVLKEPSRFYPLSGVLEDATNFYDSVQNLSSDLASTPEGTRLLSYMEASLRGQERSRTCSVYKHRCPSPTEDMINYDSLCLWSEMVRWLTIHVAARKSQWNMQHLPHGTYTPWV